MMSIEFGNPAGIERSDIELCKEKAAEEGGEIPPSIVLIAGGIFEMQRWKQASKAGSAIPPL